jgi:hypothetical protein
MTTVPFKGKEDAVFFQCRRKNRRPRAIDGGAEGEAIACAIDDTECWKRPHRPFLAVENWKRSRRRRICNVPLPRGLGVQEGHTCKRSSCPWRYIRDPNLGSEWVIVDGSIRLRQHVGLGRRCLHVRTDIKGLQRSVSIEPLEMPLDNISMVRFRNPSHLCKFCKGPFNHNTFSLSYPTGYRTRAHAATKHCRQMAMEEPQLSRLT